MAKKNRAKRLRELAAIQVRRKRRQSVEDGHRSASTQARPEPLPSPGLLADERGMALLERFDSLAWLRNSLRKVSTQQDHWAGIPMPLEGERLVIEPSYPRAAELAAIGQKPAEPVAGEDKITVRNSFYSSRWRCEIYVIERSDGRVEHVKHPRIHSLAQALSTLGCSDAWGIEQEARAQQLLGTMISHRAFKQYLLTGTFLETSKRSRVTYLFRRLRPTVAVVPHRKRDDMRILCALCMHPIAYYAGSWAGAMCPTDDVVAHLAMMRGDEPMLWRRANQHPAWAPEAGL